MTSLLDPVSDRVHLPGRTTRRTIRSVHARKRERAPAIIAATGIEFRRVISEGEQVFPGKCLEPYSRGFEISLAFFEPLLRHQRIRETPSDLRITAR
jgi:hypothetical protein